MASNELTPNSEDRIICVKVGKVKRENLYEMTRKYWKVDINRARRATHVLAIVNGIVEESFWALKTSIQHILGKMYQPSMAKAKIQLSTSICR